MNLWIKKGLGILGILAFLSCTSVAAQTVNLGNQTCTQNYTLYDYYDNGKYNFSSWEPDGMNCFDNGGGDYSYSDPGYGGGGGGVSIDPDGAWITPLLGVPPDTKLQINLVKKQVRTDMVNCGSDFGSWGQAATFYVSQSGNSNFQVSTDGRGPYVTLITPDGRIDMYRFTKYGSLQFKPKENATCGGEGWNPAG